MHGVDKGRTGLGFGSYFERKIGVFRMASAKGGAFDPAKAMGMIIIELEQRLRTNEKGAPLPERPS